MNTKYFVFGKTLSNLDAGLLQYEISKELLKACCAHPSFRVIELGSYTYPNNEKADVIIVECTNDSVPSRNSVGIKLKERLALLYCPSPPNNFPHEVRALRQDFPVTLHQNHVLQGEPASLCLYFEGWTHIERSWTPQKYLKRILWWLEQTSHGTLHRSDQPLEHLYFASNWQVILPPDFDKNVNDAKKALKLDIITEIDNTKIILRGTYIDRKNFSINTGLFDHLVLDLAPVSHGPIQVFPSTLGELHDQLSEKGSDLAEPLYIAIKNYVTSDGIDKPCPTKKKNILLILHIPKTRLPGIKPEQYQYDDKGFCIMGDLATLGIAIGALIKDPDHNKHKVYVDNFTTSCKKDGGWRTLPIVPIDIKHAASLEIANKISGIPENNSRFKGILAGVGALGSALAEIWSREGWGEWTYVDNDILQPHNIIRHTGKDFHIGRFKAIVVKQISECNFTENTIIHDAINAKITDSKDQRVCQAIQIADLLIDATTTLEVPRDLSALEKRPRLVSVFITPSGMSSVLILEDKEHLIPLSALEAQYYRAILHEEWGNDHLNGHFGELWTGGGCRDISIILSNELVQVHAATLARHIRKKVECADANICTWSLNDATGDIFSHNIPVNPPSITVCGSWNIICDEAISQKLHTLRAAKLPNETGGIILGYYDHKEKKLYLVDVLSAPEDSQEDQASFIRGKLGLDEKRVACLKRTANIVDYVGDWHSHPNNTSTHPSTLDNQLLLQLAQVMKQDGLPILMAIVGKNDINFSFNPP